MDLTLPRAAGDVPRAPGDRRDPRSRPRSSFVTYADRYIAAKGPQAALVGTWLKYVVKQ